MLTQLPSFFARRSDKKNPPLSRDELQFEKEAKASFGAAVGVSQNVLDASLLNASIVTNT